MHLSFELLTSLGAAIGLGGLVGLERETKGRWAGLRTHMMVSLAAALFMIVNQANSYSGGHVMQGIIAGIGFIGAGTILKLTDKQEVKGLTTASSVWLAAGIGIACGVQMYWEAFAATLFALLILTISWRFESYLSAEMENNKENSNP